MNKNKKTDIVALGRGWIELVRDKSLFNQLAFRQ